MMKEEIKIKFNKLELLDIERAFDLLIEQESDTTYYSAYKKVKDELHQH